MLIANLRSHHKSEYCDRDILQALFLQTNYSSRKPPAIPQIPNQTLCIAPDSIPAFRYRRIKFVRHWCDQMHTLCLLSVDILGKFRLCRITQSHFLILRVCPDEKLTANVIYLPENRYRFLNRLAHGQFFLYLPIPTAYNNHLRVDIARQ